ncbi:conserved hypothetical protein [Altererythrobacter sp. B11]|uniref:hypothetical protein n=1 Tax=Altererythrobacter sp. B11 TaxID=2060312 RepID=UPI000DC71F58|nr:hypothetical protein [Altererythrobacter sp. B11]BBC72957.1 conserved hypothetical protein [Altererythrobacter sp. B11]
MDHTATPSLSESLASAIDWWREAGVDCSFADEPQGWLAEEAPVQPASPAATAAPRAAEEEPPPPPIGGMPEQWPRDLSAFREWWLAEPSLAAGSSARRVPPRGPAGAPLMVLVPMPEAEDEELLLSGAEGRLVTNMARAMGFDMEQVYLASALPAWSAVPDWSGLTEAGLGAVLRHHCALARPKRLIVLGRSILPLLGHNPTQDATQRFQIDIDSRPLPALVGFAPGRLLEHPKRRARLWRNWLEWTDDGVT